MTRTPGGAYQSGDKPVEDLTPPPIGPAPGARKPARDATGVTMPNDHRWLIEALAQSLFISSQGWPEWPTLDDIRDGVERALKEPDVLAHIQKVDTERTDG